MPDEEESLKALVPPPASDAIPTPIKEFFVAEGYIQDPDAERPLERSISSGSTPLDPTAAEQSRLPKTFVSRSRRLFTDDAPS